MPWQGVDRIHLDDPVRYLTNSRIAEGRLSRLHSTERQWQKSQGWLFTGLSSAQDTPDPATVSVSVIGIASIASRSFKRVPNITSSRSAVGSVSIACPP